MKTELLKKKIITTVKLNTLLLKILATSFARESISQKRDIN